MPGQRIPAGQLWGGNPAKFLRDLTDEEKENNFVNATVSLMIFFVAGCVVWFIFFDNICDLAILILNQLTGMVCVFFILLARLT